MGVGATDAIGPPRNMEGEELTKKASSSEARQDLFEEYFRLRRESKLVEEHRNRADQPTGQAVDSAHSSHSESDRSWERDVTFRKDGESSDNLGYGR